MPNEVSINPKKLIAKLSKKSKLSNAELKNIGNLLALHRRYFEASNSEYTPPAEWSPEQQLTATPSWQAYVTNFRGTSATAGGYDALIDDCAQIISCYLTKRSERTFAKGKLNDARCLLARYILGFMYNNLRHMKPSEENLIEVEKFLEFMRAAYQSDIYRCKHSQKHFVKALEQVITTISKVRQQMADKVVCANASANINTLATEIDSCVNYFAKILFYFRDVDLSLVPYSHDNYVSFGLQSGGREHFDKVYATTTGKILYSIARHGLELKSSDLLRFAVTKRESFVRDIGIPKWVDVKIHSQLGIEVNSQELLAYFKKAALAVERLQSLLPMLNDFYTLVTTGGNHWTYFSRAGTVLLNLILTIATKELAELATIDPLLTQAMEYYYKLDSHKKLGSGAQEFKRNKHAIEQYKNLFEQSLSRCNTAMGQLNLEQREYMGKCESDLQSKFVLLKQRIADFYQANIGSYATSPEVRAAVIEALNLAGHDFDLSPGDIKILPTAPAKPPIHYQHNCYLKLTDITGADKFMAENQKKAWSVGSSYKGWLSYFESPVSRLNQKLDDFLQNPGSFLEKSTLADTLSEFDSEFKDLRQEVLRTKPKWRWKFILPVTVGAPFNKKEREFAKSIIAELDNFAAKYEQEINARAKWYAEEKQRASQEISQALAQAEQERASLLQHLEEQKSAQALAQAEREKAIRLQHLEEQRKAQTLAQVEHEKVRRIHHLEGRRMAQALAQAEHEKVRRIHHLEGRRMAQALAQAEYEKARLLEHLEGQKRSQVLAQVEHEKASILQHLARQKRDQALVEEQSMPQYSPDIQSTVSVSAKDETTRDSLMHHTKFVASCDAPVSPGSRGVVVPMAASIARAATVKDVKVRHKTHTSIPTAVKSTASFKHKYICTNIDRDLQAFAREAQLIINLNRSGISISPEIIYGCQGIVTDYQVYKLPAGYKVDSHILNLKKQAQHILSRHKKYGARFAASKQDYPVSSTALTAARCITGQFGVGDGFVHNMQRRAAANTAKTKLSS